MSLDSIGIRHGTDQASLFHDYLNRFEPYFAPKRNDEVRLLELGIYKGASVRTWHEYFTKGTILAVDFDPQTLYGLPADRVRAFIGDTYSHAFWQSFTERDFDFIIDDGDHHAAAQWFAFQQGFPRLKPSGLYIVQDTHFEGYKAQKLFSEAVGMMNAGWENGCGRPVSDIASVTFSRSLIFVGKKISALFC